MAARVSGVWHTGSTRCGFSSLDADKEKVILNISSENGREDYLFSATDSSISFQKTKDMRFQGSFGLATEQGGKVEQLYMVNACLFETSEITIMSEVDNVRSPCLGICL